MQLFWICSSSIFFVMITIIAFLNVTVPAVYANRESFDLSDYEKCVANGTASLGDRIILFLLCFIGSFLGPLYYVTALILGAILTGVIKLIQHFT